MRWVIETIGWFMFSFGLVRYMEMLTLLVDDPLRRIDYNALMMLTFCVIGSVGILVITIMRLQRVIETGLKPPTDKPGRISVSPADVS
jgi:hypothetical protein